MYKFKIYVLFITSLIILGISHIFAQTPSQLFQQALLKENGEGDLKSAVEIYQKIANDATADREFRAKALLRVGICWEKLGKETAAQTYQRLIQEFSDQSDAVNEARNRLANLRVNHVEKPTGLSLTKIWRNFKIVPKNLHSISPDGKFITAIHQSNGFCLIDLDTKTIQYLTDYKQREKELYEGNPSQAAIDSFYNAEKWAFSSAWSKEGKRFVYSWCDWSGKKAELRIMTLDGKIEKTFAGFEDLTWLIVADWSNDGERVLLTAMTKEGESSLLVFNLSNQSIKYQKKVNQKEIKMYARFSPDGQFIAYDIPATEHQGKKDIYLFDVNNNSENLLLQNDGEDQLFGWTPGGDRILFASDRSGSLDAWTISVKQGMPDGEPILVKKNIGKIYPLGISENGTFYYAGEFEAVDVFLTHLSKDGDKIEKNPVRIAEQFIGSNSTPSCSPDGTKIAYLSQRGAQRDELFVVIHTIATEERKEYQLKFKKLQSINWGLDGKSLLLTGTDENDQTGIFGFDLVDSNTHPLYFFPEKETYTSWAAPLPENNKIIFVHRPSGSDTESKIMLLDVVSKQVRELDRLSTWPVNAILTPDKKHLTFREWREQKEYIYQIPVTGGEREIIAEFENEYIASFAWSPDASRLYFVKGTYQDGSRSLWLLDLGTKEISDLGLKLDFMRELQLHPGGQKLLFQAGEVNFEIWAMKGF